MAAAHTVAAALIELNRQLDEGYEVVAYRLRRDDDLEGNVADVLYRLPPPSDGREWPLELLDALCERSYAALKEWVEFTFCTFHTAEEVEAVLGSPGHAGWMRLDGELVTA